MSDPNPARSVLIGLAQRPHLLTAQTRHLRNLRITEHAELEQFKQVRTLTAGCRCMNIRIYTKKAYINAVAANRQTRPP